MIILGEPKRGNKDIKRKRKDMERGYQDKERMKGSGMMKGDQLMRFRNKKNICQAHWVTT